MKKQKATGHCFYNSYQTLMSLDDDARLVHGIVWGEGVGYHVHGWVEFRGMCFDQVNGKSFAIPQERYYEIGKIKTGKGEIFKYTREEAIKKTAKANQYYFSKLPCKQ